MSGGAAGGTERSHATSPEAGTFRGEAEHDPRHTKARRTGRASVLMGYPDT